MEPIPNFTFDFTKDPPLDSITKKYFVEWVRIDEYNEKYLIDCKEFDSFEEARKEKTGLETDSVGFIYRNRRYLCQIK